ncbi:MAG: hypothetical protein LAO51_14905 [Acidobacteriia bacterium]|nr:hypothetical protein [Terriglobia bacterium]
MRRSSTTSGASGSSMVSVPLAKPLPGNARIASLNPFPEARRSRVSNTCIRCGEGPERRSTTEGFSARSRRNDTTRDPSHSAPITSVPGNGASKPTSNAESLPSWMSRA